MKHADLVREHGLVDGDDVAVAPAEDLERPAGLSGTGIHTLTLPEEGSARCCSASCATEVAGVCRQLAAAGLVIGTAGNVSARDGDLVAVTPSGLDYAVAHAPRLVGVHRLDGSPVEAPLQPTSELPLHLSVYAATGTGARSCTPTPPPRRPLRPWWTRSRRSTTTWRCSAGRCAVAPYATYGTEELAAHVTGALHGRTGCLMANHGAVTTGPDLATAYGRAVYLEWLCDVYLRAAAAGTPRLLPPAEIDRVAHSSPAMGSGLPAERGPGRSRPPIHCRQCRAAGRRGHVAGTTRRPAAARGLDRMETWMALMFLNGGGMRGGPVHQHIARRSADRRGADRAAVPVLLHP